MWRSIRPIKSERPSSPTLLRDRLARLLALFTFIGVGVILFASVDLQLLMPGPLTSAHSAIKACRTCHTESGSGKLSWMRGLIAGSPHDDSKACLSCHKMPATAFNAHGASADVLQRSTARLAKVVRQTSVPFEARAQSTAFPTHDMVANGINCATCHQEHQGANFNLGKISNEQCRSCHAVKFDSFDGSHPELENYPFTRRTPIIYDHVGHFDKHFPEAIKKDPTTAVPITCSACHDSRNDRRVMAVLPFEKTCSACHLDQIKGKERASGPKGIAFLSLPGLDVQTLKDRKAPIGEWPETSEAELTPFMRVMISRSDHGRALITSTRDVNLQDLSKTSDAQIKAVVDLVWEIKRLFGALLTGKASDVFSGINIGNDGKLNANIIADLTAGIPRDVIVSAQQQWLPNLSSELSSGPLTAHANERQLIGDGVGTHAQSIASSPPEDPPEKPQSTSEHEESEEEPIKTVKRDPPACSLRILGQCIFNQNAGKTAETKGSENAPAPSGLPAAMRAGLSDVRPAAGQSDDLLFPTDAELRDMKTRAKSTVSASPANPPSQVSTANNTPAPRIDSSVDAESWAEYGGWYQQDHAIFYRPSGHKDRFIATWLALTGPEAPRGSISPAASVFDALTNKDAQGSCTKCHSVDDIVGKGRAVNFAQPSPATKQGRFTAFIHEPHFGVLDNRGCLTCHALQKKRAYLESYKQGNPWSFVSNFDAIKKETCQTCHTRKLVQQDCLTCHKYHVNGIITPTVETKIPIQ